MVNKNEKRTEVRFHRGTISVNHQIKVIAGGSCTIIDGSCQNGASRDPSFHYSLQNLPDLKPQFTPGSTASTTSTIHGHSFSGYSVIDHAPSFIYHWQRPALSM